MSDGAAGGLHVGDEVVAEHGADCEEHEVFDVHDPDPPDLFLRNQAPAAPMTAPMMMNLNFTGVLLGENRLHPVGEGSVDADEGEERDQRGSPTTGDR